MTALADDPFAREITVELLAQYLARSLARLLAQECGMSQSIHVDRAREVLAAFGFRYCRACGCSDEDACAPRGRPSCDWISEDLCSACATPILLGSPQK